MNTSARRRVSKSACVVARSLVENLESRQLLSRVVGYLPDYRYTDTINKIDWATMTNVDYFSIKPEIFSVSPGSFTEPTTTSGGASYPIANLFSTVTTAHANNVSVSLVIGGAGYSDAVPGIAADATLTNNFVTNLKTFCSAHNIDGVDLDWEPDWGTATPTQVNNYATLISAIKTAAPALALSAAVAPTPQPMDPAHPVTGPQAYVLTAGAANALDYVNVMAYDFQNPNHSDLVQSENALHDWARYVDPSGASDGKFVLGLPFYARNSAGDAITYADVWDSYHPTASTNNTNGWYFNGQNWITQKTQYANAFGGVMVWELAQDHFNGNAFDANSLFPMIAAATVNNTFANNDSLGHLALMGTGGADTFTISVSGSNLVIQRGPITQSFALASINTITIQGLSGDDTLEFNGPVSKPVAFYGGGGFDTVNVNAGALAFDTDVAIGNAALVINVADGASATFNASQHLDGLNVNGTATMSANGARVLMTNGISAGANGKLDLNDNDMIVNYTGPTSLPAVQALLNAGRHSGDWLAVRGITSSSARNNIKHNTTLGAMEATSFKSMYGNAAPFDGETIGNTSVLIKYTYYGDANFNGKVDGADYSRIDSTFNNEHSAGNIGGWINGDFNGDGKVDGADYGLIDGAFNSQGVVLRPAAGGTSITLPGKTGSSRR